MVAGERFSNMEKLRNFYSEYISEASNMEYLEQYISVSSNQCDRQLQITKIDKAFKVHCGGGYFKELIPAT